jgi:DNA mismatch repair protein MutS
MTELTPLMSQYREIKSQYKDCILLFRVGDFYETFYEDAVEVSSTLNIALTTRDKNKPNPIPLAGVPFHAAETYITRLLSSGKKVAVCDQVEDASLAKGLVKRRVTEVLTPGTAMNSQLLDDSENNYCLSLCIDGTRAGVAVIDVSTGDFLCGEEDLDSLHHLVQGKHIKEMVCRASESGSSDNAVVDDLVRFFDHPYVARLDGEQFTAEAAAEAFDRQFGEGAAGVAGALTERERIAAGALLGHCQSLRDGSMPQVVAIERLAGVSFLSLDEETISNLELFEPMRGGSSKATLIHTIDHTLTPMGGRELRRWIQKPLAVAALAEERLDAVQALFGDASRFEEVVRSLKGIADLQRLSARIAARKAIPREFHALRESLEKLPALQAALEGARSGFLEGARRDLGDHAELCEGLARAIVPDPPGHLRDGGVIAKGYDADLDELIAASEGARRWIARLESRERDRSGIASLKVGYNKVFGYYIEVSNAHNDRVPEDYIAKQTLVSAQRYYTEALKEKEQLILETQERRVQCEQRVYERLCATVASTTPSLQRAAAGVARIDAIHSMAASARVYGYRRPVLDDGLILDIVGGRHPVLERLGDEPFVPNDLTLDPERKQFGLITGPNMSGKSTFLRQTALIVLLAQMGSFVPADRARIGVVDQVFTRVGASDRLSRGESTFLVEMNETANILRKMTDRSLVLLDEIGRGTSTFDGLSIAWAVTEYLLQGVVARPRALFATHFHELTQLRNQYPRLVNLKITVKEWESGIIFLRKIVPGTSDKSFGIHAAKIAGLPPMVLKRAGEILASLELRRALLQDGFDIRANDDQYTLFAPPGGRSADTGASAPSPDPDPRLAAELRDFDLDNATPVDALLFIKRLKERLDPAE